MARAVTEVLIRLAVYDVSTIAMTRAVLGRAGTLRLYRERSVLARRGLLRFASLTTERTLPERMRGPAHSRIDETAAEGAAKKAGDFRNLRRLLRTGRRRLSAETRLGIDFRSST